MDGVGSNAGQPVTGWVDEFGRLVVTGFAHEGRVLDENTLEITFFDCVNVFGVLGVEMGLDAVYESAAAYLVTDAGPPTIVNFTFAGPIQPGQAVTWRYTQGDNSIRYCSNGTEWFGYEIRVTNSLQIAGEYLLDEMGEPILLENKTAPDDYANAFLLESGTTPVPPGTPMETIGGTPMETIGGTPMETQP